MSNFIAIDLELEQPKSNAQTTDSFIDHERILSLGICVGDENGNILHQENIFYKYEYPISAFIKHLTGINDDDVAGGVSPIEAFQRLIAIRDQFDASRILLEWGAGDFSCIVREANIDIKSNIFGRSALNVKHLYRTWCVKHKISASGGLKTSINKFSKKSSNADDAFFKFIGIPHNSQVDAVNTYLFYIKLMQTMG
jgi:hypothetical protein